MRRSKLPSNTIKKRFRSGAYPGVPDLLLNEIQAGIDIPENKDYWDNYPRNRGDILARLYQTKLRYGWAYPGEKLYYRACDYMDRVFLGPSYTREYP